MKFSIVVISSLFICSPAMGAEKHYCKSETIETMSFDDSHVASCKSGDVMFLQIPLREVPGLVIAKLCDFSFTVLVDKHEEKGHKKHRTTVTCIYQPKTPRN